MLTQVKPYFSVVSICPYCDIPLEKQRILWHGIHVCSESVCPKCKAKIIEDLPVGHARTHSYKVDLENRIVFGKPNTMLWLGKPFLESLQNPQYQTLKISKEVFKQYERVIILNCIDNLYGHCLLKLLNAQRHLDGHPDYGLVAIVPKFIRWMVPEGCAEVWTVDMPLNQGQCYYPTFDNFCREESNRFREIYVSEAYSHPAHFNITRFTRVPKYVFDKVDRLKITFCWREDRPWCSYFAFLLFRKINLLSLLVPIQTGKVIRLFKKIKAKIPQATFTVVGLGKKTNFPEWIEDLRVDNYDEKIERDLCKIYSQSCLVIGVHGSNLLLPSAHAGMAIDLMPENRWNNIAQDILYQEDNPRLAAFRYRYLPIQTSITELASIASSMILNYSNFKSNMNADSHL
jgi:hypothetical protein